MNATNLENFIDQLIAEKGFDTSKPEYIKKIKDELYDLAEDAINSEVIKRLPEDKLDEFENLFETNATDEELVKFISQNIANIDQIISEVLINFRTIYLSNSI
jgi:hypothetical protein